ncbi:MAG: uroporphyrinogen decarboxylase family protein [Oscillospiraceae bacterium]|nr:uroporphyrinogen decarboxylase family protein [Oscillospiraceae bacterium]
MNMFQWVQGVKAAKVKKAMPILSFPSIQLLDIGVKELIMDSALQAKGMKMIADRVDASASVSMMDLSVEAEAFGSEIRFSDDEVPTVIGSIVNSEADAEALAVPQVGTGRTGLYIEAIQAAAELITDRPVFAGVIGPFSLAGRLMDVSEAMIYCYDEPDMVHMLMGKVTNFLIEYMKAYKAVGADGVVVAEPLAGLLTPAFNEEFSVRYMKQIVNAVQDENFIVIYHNCGGGTPMMIDDIVSIGAMGYHFGNAIDMAEMVKKFPADCMIMGNIDPASQFRNGTPESIREATISLLEACHTHSNFVISSGCDIPPLSNWDNIDSFFTAVTDFYGKV